MSEADTQPGGEGATLAHAEMEAAVEALAEAAGEPAPSEPPRRRRATAEGAAPAGGGRDAIAGAQQAEGSGPGVPSGERAGALDVRRGCIGRVEAASVAVAQGVVGSARGERIELRQAACGAALGGEVRLEQSASRFVAARETVSLHMSGAWNVLADKVEVHPGSGVVFLVARRVEGDVRPLFDWRGGLAFGVAAGLVGGLIRRRRR